MIISITGSRSFTDYTYFTEKVNSFLQDKEVTCVVSGGASGTDALAKKYCDEKNIKILELLPDWKQFGKSAGIIRNKKIIDQSDFNIIFWDGKSKGSKFNIDYCKKNNKGIEVVLYA